MNPTSQRYRVFETAAGFCAIAWGDAGVTRFLLPLTGADETHRSLQRRLRGAQVATAPANIAEIIASARRYFAGERIDFSALPLDLGEQDPFFARVYAAVRRIGWGTTTTYGALARQLDAGPEAARDVGQAMANNPVPLIIPCHRVLAAGGKVGGFSAPGGSLTKLHMLALEGVNLGPPESTQQTLGF